MDSNALNFNIDIRDWVSENGLSTMLSGSDDTIVIQYTDDLLLLTDEELKQVQSDIAQAVARIARTNDIEYELHFDNTGSTATIRIKPPMTRDQARERYYNLITLGPKMTHEQFQETTRLKKKFGFI